MTRTLRIITVFVSILAAGLLFTNAASQAYAKGGGSRPGWGHDDDKHKHTGPPGLSTVPCKPGNGFGDKNHCHTGPPGHSIVPKPGEDEHEDDDEDEEHELHNEHDDGDDDDDD